MRVCGRDTQPSVAQLTTEVVRKVEEVSLNAESVWRNVVRHNYWAKQQVE